MAADAGQHRGVLVNWRLDDALTADETKSLPPDINSGGRTAISINDDGEINNVCAMVLARSRGVGVRLRGWCRSRNVQGGFFRRTGDLRPNRHQGQQAGAGKNLIMSRRLVRLVLPRAALVELNWA